MENSILRDVLDILPWLVVTLSMFLLYRSVPREYADKIMSKGEEIAAKTPQTWDDDALKLLRTVYDLINAQTPPTPPAPPA